MKIGDTITAKIAPAADDGSPAPVTEISWTAGQSGVWSSTLSDDKMTNVLTAVANGAGNSITVTAKNSLNVLLQSALPLPDVTGVVVPVASNLNLSLGSVVPGP